MELCSHSFFCFSKKKDCHPMMLQGKTTYRLRTIRNTSSKTSSTIPPVTKMIVNTATVQIQTEIFCKSQFS